MKKKWLWAGIDLGIETASICILDDLGDVLHAAKCPSSAKDVRHELCQYRRTRFASVGLEAGTSMHVARGLRNYGYPVTLYETRQLSKFLRVRRNKTDAGDAVGIAEAGRIGASIVSRVHLKTLECQALQARLTIRRHLVRQRVAAVSMLCRQIELFGGRLRCNADKNGFRSAVNRELRRLFPDDGCEVVQQLRILADHAQGLIGYQRDVDRELKLAALAIEQCRRFMEIPGVGPLCALTFYAAVGDPHRFSRASDVGSYFGLAPKLHESGLTAKKARISRFGNKSVRTLLVRSATLHMRYCDRNSALRDWTLRLEGRSGRGQSRVALARKLATIMMAMWKSGSSFRHDLCSPIAEEAAPTKDSEPLLARRVVDGRAGMECTAS